MQDKTVIIQPSPFRASKVMVAQQGMTVMQMITQMYDLSGVPAVWRDYAVMVEVNGIPVTRDKWTQRPSTDDHVMIHVPVHGGGGGGGKDPIRTILSIAVVVAAVAAPFAIAAMTGGSLATFAGMGASATISMYSGIALTAGMFLVDALCPIRTPDSPYIASRSSYADSPTYSISGASNRANPFGPVPVVLGKHRVFPPYGAQPYTEILGNDEYLRMLFVWGYGRLDISDIKIGETLLSSYTDYDIETVEGTSTDADITLIPDIVTQTSVNVSLTAAGGRVVRTAEAGSDELSVDIVFPRGLAYFDNNGNRTSYTVSVRVEYRKVGTLTWITQHTFTRTDATSSAIRVGHSWAVDKTKTYEVALTRLTADTDDTRTIDDVMWSVLRSIKNDPPVTFPKPLAMTALRIKATEQLQGVIDSLNAIVTSYAPTWDAVSGEWTTEESLTQNPAALFRLVLMHPANARPRTAAQIDDAGLGAWYVFCETNGYKFNMVRDYKSSGWETLADIAATGRASPTLTDGIWGVIIDEPDKPVIQHITPRNSWGFSSEKVLFDKPHAFRIPFTNEDEGYEKDERIVYDDGYTAANATQFESVEFPGITDPDLIWKFGRYYIAAARLRPETYSLYQDFEHLAVRRGQKVRVSHDVPMWGSGWGRVKSVIIGDAEADPPTDPTKTYGVVLDEKVVMAAGESYACRFRLADESNTSLSLSVVNDGAGESATLTFTTPITTTDGPQEGDLAMFGEANTETVELLVKGIERASDYTAKLILVDEAPHIYTADTGEIPAFVTHITGPIDVTRFVPDPPAIVGIVTGDVGADTFSGTVKPRILVHLRHDSGKVNVKTFRVRYRVDGSYMWSFAEAPAIAGTVICNEIVAGQTYEIWAQSISAYGVESAWVAGDDTVATGRTEWTPGTVQDFAVNISASGTLVLSWTRQAYLEIANYEIREGDDWDTATLVDTVNATSYRLGVALAGTYNYLIKAIDTSGNYSTVASEADITIAVPSTPEPSAEAVGEWAVVTWDDCKTSLPINYYKVNTAQRSNALRYTERINWVGKKDYSIVAIDIAGNESAAGTTSLTVTALLAVSGIAPTGLTYAVRLALTYTTFTGFVCVEIWSSTTNNRANATKIGETAAKVWTHSGLDLVDTRYYWTRTRDVYGNYSDWYPSSATAGVAGTTSTDPADYLSVLAGSITEDELYQTLNDRIDQIDTEAFIYDEDIIEPNIYNGIAGAYSGLYNIASGHQTTINGLLSTAAGHASNISALQADVASLTTSEWSATGDYTLGKYVVYGSEVYRCIQGYTYAVDGTKTPGVDTAYWEEADALATLVSSIETRVDSLEGEIVTKVSSSTFNALENRVDVTESSITQNASDILLRVTQTEFDAFSVLFLPEFSTGNTYEINDWVQYEGASYKCIQTIDFTPAPLPTNATYWESATYANEFTTVMNQVDINTSGISLMSSAITGDLTYLFDTEENRTFETGVYVESAEDIRDLDIRLTQAGMDIDGAEANIALHASLIDGIDDRLSQAEIDIDGANAQIALKASQSSLDETNAELAAAELVIDGHTASIGLHATQISTLQSTTGTHTTQISQAQVDIDAAEAAILLKASQTALDTTNSNLSTLTGRVSTAETAISAGEAGTWSSISSKATAATVNALDTRVGTVETGISGLQTQIDGKIETYYTDTDPNTWASGDRTKHTGDMWYAPTTHLLKRYDGTLNSWSTIEDQKAIDAYTNAARAQDTADGKRRVFVTTPTTPYDVGDLWSGGSSGDLKRCKTQRLTGAYQAGDWELASKYTDDSSLTTFISTYNNDQKVGGVLRISTAESNISTLQSNMSTAQSDITDRVTVATYNADQKVDGVLRIAAAESTLSAQGGDITNMKAQYTLKLNVNDRVAGIGLMLSEDAPSEFIVLADKFQVVNPTDTMSPKAVFTVGNINGVSAVGINGDLIIDGSILARNIGANEVITNVANIKDGLITNAKLVNATIEAGKIKDATITGAKIAAATIENANIKDATISSAKIASLSADKITAGTIGAETINVGDSHLKIDGMNKVIKVYDDDDNLRVELGLLS